MKRATSGRAVVKVRRKILDIKQIAFEHNGDTRLSTIAITNDGKAFEQIERALEGGTKRRFWLEMPDIEKDVISIDDQRIPPPSKLN